MKKILLLLLLLFICYLLFFFNKPVLKSKCWIDTSIYPEAKYIFNNRHIIKNELLNILNSNKWALWSSEYNEAPSFTRMTHQEIVSKINTSKGKMNSDEKMSWRLYGLILNKEILETAESCPKTMEILSKSSKILNAGFSLLEPNSSTKPHVDYNNKFYRLHIPLIIPTNNSILNNSILDKSYINKKLTILQVEDEYRAWKEDEYFIFDDTCLHNAWNSTDENRIVLLVDLLKE
jgi:aspartyl/asparaginyl beta-hydroxylase (cupin superfamily)